MNAENGTPEPKREKLLLHVCCAPCGGGCLERLQGRKLRLFFSNSNLASREEFDRRLACVKRLAELFDLPLTVDPYDHGAWLASVAGLEGEAEGGARCRKCFEFNLGRTAEACGKDEAFSTTLTVSPRKSSRVLFETGELWPELFEAWDFKKKNGYLRGVEIARANGFYRQDFCGCEFSLAERLRQKENAPSCPGNAPGGRCSRAIPKILK